MPTEDELASENITTHITPAMQKAFDQLITINKNAKITVFHENGRFLTDEQITTILEAIKKQQALFPSEQIDNNIRFSQRYLKEQLKIKIDRGGVICTKDAKGELTLSALCPGYLVGSGGFSKVKLMQIQTPTTGDQFEVLKVMQKTCKDQEERDKLLRAGELEAKCLAKREIGGAFIIKKIHAPNESKPENENPLFLKFYIRMKYFKGHTLGAYLEQGKLPHDYRYDVMFKLLLDIKLMHQEEILHRDIKPRNIMIDHHAKTARLIDYGFAMPLSEIKPTGKTERIVGTIGYLAPELMSGHLERFSVASDVFAVGRVMQEVFGIEEQVVIRDKEKGEKIIRFGVMDPKVRAQISDAERSLLKRLIDQILVPDPEKRPTVTTIIYQLSNIFDHIKSPDVFEKTFRSFQSTALLLNKIKFINDLKLVPPISDQAVELNEIMRDPQFLTKKQEELTLEEEYQLAVVDRFLISKYVAKIDKMQRDLEKAVITLKAKNYNLTFFSTFPQEEKALEPTMRPKHPKRSKSQ